MSQEVEPKSSGEGRLSEGWRWVRFGDVVRNVTVTEANPKAAGLQRFVGLDHVDSGSIRIKRWGLIAEGTTFTRRFQSGQVLFAKRRAYQGKVAIADFEGVCSGDLLVFEAKGDLLPELLPFVVATEGFRKHAVQTSAGSLSPRTKWSELSKFEFALPPLAEQQRIVQLLNTVEDQIAAWKKVIGETGAASAAFADEVLRTVLGSGDKYVGSQPRLGDLFKQRRETGHRGLPILSVTLDGRVVPRESLGRQVIDNTGEEKYLRVQPGDLAYNTMRMWQGACGVVPVEGLVSSAYTVMTASRKDIDVRFWWALFRRPLMKNVFRRFSTGVAKDRWRLYYRDFARIAIVPPASDVVETFLRRVAHTSAIADIAISHMNTLTDLKSAFSAEFLEVSSAIQ